MAGRLIVEDSHSPLTPKPGPEQSLLEMHGLTSSDSDQECSNDHLLEISHELGNWQLVARHLGLEDTDIDAIKLGKLTIDLQRYYVLETWKSINCITGTATYRNLLRGLVKCQEGVLAMKVCSLLKKAPPKSGIEQPLLKRWELTSSDIIDQECSNDHLLEFSCDLGKWELVGLHLGLTTDDIVGIKEDNAEKPAKHKREHALRMWKTKTFSIGGKPTYRLLLKALLKCRSNELAMKVCESLREESNRPIGGEDSTDTGPTDPHTIEGGHNYQDLLDKMDRSPLFEADDGVSRYKLFKAFDNGGGRKKIHLSFGLIQPVAGEKLKSSEDIVYTMNRPHGVAIVISNEKFRFHKTREGTSIDESNLIITLRYLGYDVEVYNDLTKMQMCALFKRIKKRNLKNWDSFVCCILTHGSMGELAAFDSDPKDPQGSFVIDTLKNELSETECPQLKKKPKIFFLQACRNNKPTHTSDSLPEHGRLENEETSSLNNPGSSSLQTAISRNFPSPDNSGSHAQPDCDKQGVGHFFFGYATPPGQSAWRDPEHGSWYISELCRALCTYKLTQHLEDIVTKVHREVSQRYEYKQTPEKNSTLDAKVFF